MPKIKIEIEVSGEIVGIISGLLEAKMDHSIGKSMLDTSLTTFLRQIIRIKRDQNNRYEKETPIERGKKKAKNPRGKHARKGGWTQRGCLVTRMDCTVIEQSNYTRL